jgi:transposase-like protein
MQTDPQIDTFSLDSRRAHALRMLIRGDTLQAIQRELGISRATLFRWRREYSFQLALFSATRGRVHSSSARVDSLVTQALDLLEDLITDPSVPAALRALAASAILEHARRPVAPPKGPGRIPRTSISAFTSMVAGLSKAVAKAT